MKKELDIEAQYAHVKKGGVHLYVKHDGVMVGKLSATDTTISWFPRKAKKPIVNLAWDKFDAAMKNLAEGRAK